MSRNVSALQSAVQATAVLAMMLAPVPVIAGSPGAARPVVVELFTAQGCAGCPDANATLENAIRDREVVALTYGVDYWDYLGWRDTFARPEFTERQKSYRQSLGLRSVATPQVVIDGERHLVPRDPLHLTQAMEQEASNPLPPPDIQFRETGDRVAVGSGRIPEGGAEVVAVLYSPGVHTVEVHSGDNRGRTVRHVNVVKEIHHLGEWRGHPILYRLPPDLSADSVARDAVVVMVQGRADRRILSVARMPEPRRD